MAGMSGVDPALQSFINQETEKQRFQVRFIHAIQIAECVL